MTSPSLAWADAPPPVSLPRALSDAQVAQYLRDGFLIIEGLVTPAELEEIKADFVKIAKGGYQPSNIRALPEDMPDDEVLKNVLAIHHPHYLSPVMK